MPQRPIVRLETTIEAGLVSRYHAAPKVQAQITAHHQWNVLTICLYLTENRASRNLILEAAYHDSEELGTGDAPTPVKEAYPELRRIYKEFGKEYRETETLVATRTLKAYEQKILKLADTLDGVLWCAEHESASGATFSKYVERYHHYREVWQTQLSPKIWERANEIFNRYQQIGQKTHLTP